MIFDADRALSHKSRSIGTTEASTQSQSPVFHDFEKSFCNQGARVYMAHLGIAPPL
jgi:hypothetical protein